MFCPNCGRELPDDAKFCGSCGANLNARPQGSAQPSQASQAQQTAQEQVGKAVASVQAQVDKLQQKIDSSNSTAIKGRDAWDIIGLIGVICMLLGFCVPSVTMSSSWSGASYGMSLVQLFINAWSTSYSHKYAYFLLMYLFPACFCTFDLLIVEENALRHLRLIIMGAFNILLQTSISDVGGLLSFVGGTLSIGYYLNVIGSVIVIVVGIVGILNAKKH